MSYNAYGYSSEMNEIRFLKPDTPLGTDEMELSTEVMLNSNGVICKSGRPFPAVNPGQVSSWEITPKLSFIGGFFLTFLQIF